jgi:pyridoxal biosynthesis lyase PdxS
MAEKGAVKGLGSQTVEMTLERGEAGAGDEHIRHHRKISQKFTQLPRVSEEEESPARLVKPMQGK